MLRKTLVALMATVLAAAGGFAAVKATSNAAGPSSVLVGDTSVEKTTDSNGSQPQAWQYTASTTGSVTGVQAYDAKGTAKLTVGLYTDAGGKPGTLLATGSLAKTKANAWNVISVGSATVTAGTKYWLAWQGTDSFRDNSSGSCTTVGGSSVGKVGSSWATAWTASGFCPASLYESGTASVPPPPPPPPPTTTTTPPPPVTTTPPPVTTTPPPPPPTGSQTVNCAPTSSTTMTNTVSHNCGFADTTNTGVPVNTSLVNITGDGNLSSPPPGTGSGWTYGSSNETITLNAGGVVKDIKLVGGVNIVGSNATVEDSNITCPGADCYAVQLRDAANVVVTNNTLQGSSATTGDACDDAVRDISNNSDNITITDNNMFWCAAPINNVANGGLIQGNYIHDFAAAAPDNHFDGIQLEPGNGDLMTIRDNTILMNSDQTSPIILSNDGGGTQTNRTVTHNLLAGGDYCFYGSASVGAKATGIVFTNNSLSRLFYSTCGFFDAVANITPGTVFSGNIWDDTGQPVSQ